MSVDAVVFDLGQVLVRWDPFGPFVGRMDRDDVEAFFADIDFPSFNHHQDAGRPWAQARAEVRARFPQHAGAIDLYVEHFADALPGPVPGSEQLVRDLLDAGVRTYAVGPGAVRLVWHLDVDDAATDLAIDVLTPLLSSRVVL